MSPSTVLAAAYLIVGLALFVGLLLPRLTENRAISSPIVLLIIGLAAGLVPLPDGVTLHPLDHPALAEQLTTVTIIVALTGVGLALDRPLQRTRRSWQRWNATWRLIFIAMPLAIAITAALGWWLAGLVPGAALVLAAALAPTDPVLASDVQVGGPTVDVSDDALDEDDEVRFALTSEAGLNDGAAFPFVVAGLSMLSAGSVWSWAPAWIAWELIGRTLIGVLVGWVVGTLLGKLAFRAPKGMRFADLGDPLLIVAAPFIAYGLGELVHGWAFLSVFVCALCMRASEPTHEYHDQMHGVIERLEHLLTLLLLLLLGAALTDGMLGDLTWPGALVGLLLIFVVRPVTAWLALWSPGTIDRAGDGVLGPRERLATAFLGVRGIGTLFYLAYATAHSQLDNAAELWSIAGFTVALSVLVHGMSASPVVNWLDRARQRNG
ncbi:sodium:proton antiporter [Yimella sp. cx-51]|uniref:cation:proton antiporter n=1 Tax=Yimella sp. cx-51 TaxID=2770551 RepID=UPI00165DDE16|nr:cation:proton antiporter [Yimella sp. cx-51]MBC9957445.1 cation:proton antiporter [Yimella sp. cx-51]QTH39318.1 cation:proton antiporter [Yimella sp. cx-51]